MEHSVARNLLLNTDFFSDRDDGGDAVAAALALKVELVGYAFYHDLIVLLLLRAALHANEYQQHT